MRSSIGVVLLVLLATATALPPAAFAREGDDWPAPDLQKKVGVSARFEPAAIEPGGTANLRVRVQTAPTWHIYTMGEKESLPTSFRVGLPEGWSLAGEWKEPAPKPFLGQGATKPSLVHEGRFVFEVPVRVPEGFAVGSYPIRGTLSYMACDLATCLPPNSVDFEATLAVGKPGETTGEDAAAEKIDIEVDPARSFGAAADVKPARVPPGGQALLRVHVETAPTWHIYSMTDTKNYPTRIEFPELPEGISFVEGSAWSGPEAESFLQFDGTTSMVHEGRIVFERAIRIADAAPAGEVVLRGKLDAMACDPRTCKAPASVPLEAKLSVDPEAEAAEVAVRIVESGGPVGGGGDRGGVGGGMLKLVITAILGAMISWIMPCVYPMIPIILSFFGKLAEEKHTGKTGVAISYGVGIAGTFILIGLVVGLLTLFVADASQRSGLASLGNSIATNPWINLVIGVVFILFALSMFGMFTIQVPSWLISKTDSAGRASGSAHVGAILLGITFALASFTCTVPVVGFLLGLAASGSTSGFASSILGMVIYGSVFAAPFVILSLFPKFLSSLPKAGGWMETVKIGFGFLEIAVAIKFLWVPDLEWGFGILTRPVVLALFAVIILAAAAYFLGFYRVGHGPKTRPLSVSGGRWIAALLTLVFLFPVGSFLAAPPAYKTESLPGWVAIGMETVLPPAPAGDELARLEGWFVDDYEGALEKARAENKPLFIDFTGVYCGNCRAMEQAVFPEPPVPEKFDEMVLTRLYVDRPEEKHKRFATMQIERYGLASQPYYVVVDPHTEKTLAEGGGYILHRNFVKLLDEGLRKFEEIKKDMAAR
jgi:thiol:disulfide interchange protein DsbD